MNQKKIVITTGDIDGIGLEVACKALKEIGPTKGITFFLFRSGNESKHADRYLKLVDQKFERIVVDDLGQALSFYSELVNAKDLNKKILIDIASDLSPAHWVQDSALACFNKKLSAMATGPISKTCIKEAGFKDLGHTDILKRISKAKTVHMGFVGNYFNVVLATGHIPLNQVSKKLNFQNLCIALMSANLLRKSLPAKQAAKPIGVLGLNPHAGEKGLIGKEELTLQENLQAFAKENKIPISNFLVPDAAFLKANWASFSTYLALYHDQGLVPFKTIHGQDSGVHISLGIPFVRTSVDHGTAKDIFGKNKANHKSMVDAIQWANKLSN